MNFSKPGFFHKISVPFLTRKILWAKASWYKRTPVLGRLQSGSDLRKCSSSFVNTSRLVGNGFPSCSKNTAAHSFWAWLKAFSELDMDMARHRVKGGGRKGRKGRERECVSCETLDRQMSGPSRTNQSAKAWTQQFAQKGKSQPKQQSKRERESKVIISHEATTNR